MTQKERLVELLKDFHKPTADDDWDEEELEIYRDEEAVKETEAYYDELADFFLSNGVIVPPCKVGDVVYWLHVHCTDPSDNDCDGSCYSCGCSSINIEKWIINSLYRMVIAMESWKQCCFPTHEAAEQALKERDK